MPDLATLQFQERVMYTKVQYEAWGYYLHLRKHYTFYATTTVRFYYNEIINIIINPHMLLIYLYIFLRDRERYRY